MQKLLEEYFDRLFRIPRSLTGDGVRTSLKILREIIDLEIHEVPTGTKAFDWTVPREWNVNEAYILTPEGKKIANFSENNLHLIGYSVPFRGTMTLDELRPHLITRPDYPDAIPYATSYYEERWGFCLEHNELIRLPERGAYTVVVDTTLTNGSMTCGEAVLKGETGLEILFSSYICHPQMANNELSGPLAIAFLYRELKKLKKRKYTYRFFLGPETLGAIWYLSVRGEHFMKNLEAGLVATCCGDAGEFTFKKSRPDSYVNRLMEHLLAHRTSGKYKVKEFFPMGSDERQYGSPGFNLPVGCLCRSMYGSYPEYHTSKDNKSIMNFGALAETIQLMSDFVRSVELEARYINTSPFTEPQLGRRGLYPTLMSELERGKSLQRLLYLLNYADGNHSLLEIANLMNEPLLAFETELARLEEAGLIRKEFKRIYEVLH